VPLFFFAPLLSLYAHTSRPPVFLRASDLLILRPLRETSAKELAFYLHAKRLSYVTQREATMGTPSKAFKGTMRGMTERE
jgi:hypothetical protein